MLRLLIFSFALILLGSCSQGSAKKTEEKIAYVKPLMRDLTEIKESGKLIALTDFSSSSYFIYKGVPMGFEYDLLERFADHVGVELSIQIVQDMDHVMDSLSHGQGYLIAANFTVTQRRKNKVLYLEPILETRQVLIQKMPENYWKMTQDRLDKALVRDISGLIGKTIHVRKETSFYTRLLNIMDEIGGIIDVEFAGDIGTEKLIEMVSTGEIEYTMADENIAILNKGYYPNIDIKTPMSFNQRIAWATRKNHVELQSAFQDWFERFKKTEEFAMIHLKYFKARTKHRERVLSEYSSLKGNKISPYDKIIKKEAERLDWDWKLLAAMIYQESHFIPDAEAWTGASGLMQLIPATASRFGADSVQDPNQNIHAGVSFLLTLKEYWYEHLPDSIEKTNYILGSYNVGLGHVLDAQRLAEKNGSDKSSWEDVAIYLELKSQRQYYKDKVVKHGYCRGREPVNYVKEINQLWEHYKNAPI